MEPWLRRILLGVLALCALGVLLGASAALLLHWTGRERDALFQREVRDALWAREVQLAGHALGRELRTYVLEGHAEHSDDYQQARSDFDRALAELPGTGLQAPEHLLREEVRAQAQRLTSAAEHLLEARAASSGPGALVRLDAQLRETGAVLNASLRQLARLHEAQLHDAHAASRRTTRQALALLGGLAAASLVLTGALAGVVVRRSRQAQHAFELEQRLMAMVTHDLRTPLAAIQTSAALLLRKPLAPEVLPKVERVQRSARTLESRVALLMDVARARHGAHIPLERTAVDLGIVCSEALEEARAASPGRTVELDTAGDCRGQWDGPRLSQVVGNLVQNALKYGAEDTPVRVHVRGVGSAVHLEVQNDGPPIPAARLQALFDPFRRGPTQLHARESLGLGLYIVREIVRAHGGSVDATSSPQGVTSFRVQLPRTGA